MRTSLGSHPRGWKALGVAAASLMVLAAAASPAAGPPRAPPSADLIEVVVHDVVPLGEEGHVVMLLSVDGQTVIPLAVDEAAAIAIAFRLAHLPAPQPLPADALDSLLAQSGGKVTAVTIDESEAKGQECRVDIRQGDHAYSLQARPAEGISMALSSGTKIHATRRFLSSAGLRRSDAEPEGTPQGTPDKPKARSKPRGRYEL